MSRRNSHCAAKLVTIDAERGSFSIRRTCCSRTAAFFSWPRAADVQQFVVGDAAPQKKREARGELEVADAEGEPSRICRPALSGVERVALDPEQKLRADQQPLERALDAEVEPAGVAALLASAV